MGKKPTRISQPGMREDIEGDTGAIQNKLGRNRDKEREKHRKKRIAATRKSERDSAKRKLRGLKK